MSVHVLVASDAQVRTCNSSHQDCGFAPNAKRHTASTTLSTSNRKMHPSLHGFRQSCEFFSLVKIRVIGFQPLDTKGRAPTTTDACGEPTTPPIIGLELSSVMREAPRFCHTTNHTNHVIRPQQRWFRDE
ncbi:hypothetical protein PINS_up021269 [Pythium insidiosum]|nr:hypothetical protein PINS_up021269 [Pythium insidiosum]